MACDDNQMVNDEFTPEMYAKAKDILISAQSVSVSLLQRQMKIGYRVALLLMDQMEKNGVVTPLTNDGCRMLIFPEQMPKIIEDK